MSQTMNEFFLASNRTVTAIVAEQEIEVRQVQIHNLDLFSMSAQHIKEYLKDADRSYPDDVIVGLFQNQDYTLKVMTMLTHITNADLKMLFELVHDQDGFIDLIRKALVVNQAYFVEKPQKKTVQKKTESTWFKSFNFLIRMGHKHDDIMQYTYGAFLAYVEEAHKQYNLDIYLQASPHLDKEGQKKYKKELNIN